MSGGADPGAAGLSLILTRPEGSDSELAAELVRAGCEVIDAPATELAVRLGDAEGRGALRRELDRLRAERGWLILPSPAAIRFFLVLLDDMDFAAADLAPIRLAAVGEGSARRLAAAGRAVDFVPARADGAALAESLPAEPGAAVLVAGSSRSRPELREVLARRGLRVRTIALYEPRPCVQGISRAIQALRERPDRILVATAPSGGEAIAAGLLEAGIAWETTRWVAIGPTTAQSLIHLGVPSARVAVARAPAAGAIVAAAATLVGTSHA